MSLYDNSSQGFMVLLDFDCCLFIYLFFSDRMLHQLFIYLYYNEGI